MVLATSILPSHATSFLFTEVIRDLASDPNSLRIKKLLLFASTQNWENDLRQLEQIDFIDLVGSLLAIAPTLERLQSHIHAIAGSLNKSAEYTLVANTIINRVSRLYLDCPVRASGQKDYEAVIQRLACDPDSLRIKKLLVLASRNIWETDVKRLDDLTFLDLVQEIYSLMPTLESLKAVLDNLAKTLSKQAEYGAIAERVCLIFQPLYSPKLPLASQAYEPIEMTLTEGMEESSLMQLLREPPIGSVESAMPPAQAAEYAYIRQSLLPDLFDLRLNIIQSANPLRVKILLFSLLHEVFTPGAEHDLLLKNHELDDLLNILLQTHKLLHELESRLLSTAKSLKEPNDYIQIAQVIVRSLKPLYIYLPLKAVAASVPKDESPTNIISVEADLPEITEPDAVKPDALKPDALKGDRSLHEQSEYTCQVLSFPICKEVNS
ncbi:MAG: hypothetical protein KME15_22565 [Drouetiella hepatica Uher 2000/2452]|jgi:hypothetical protein|uniref:Uncharacterized protein n=1 Tax=Drouetiella hepatica Uher 2000/2452 TaxID=904376 RepID=A0A951QF72_9CYAN|nr:hypothetical protein [Drouetiella hepatica Uher 2000/2452]